MPSHETSEVTTLYHDTQRRLQWTRARVEGEYNERQVGDELNRIEAELNRLINSNPYRDVPATLERLQALSQEIRTLDHTQVEPALRRFGPLIRAWNEAFESDFEMLRCLPPDMVAPEVQEAMAKLSLQLENASRFSAQYRQIRPEHIPELLTRQKALMNIVRAFARSILPTGEE